MLKLSRPRGVQQHQPRLLSEKQLECVPGFKSMNDPIDFRLATDATAAECTLFAGKDDPEGAGRTGEQWGLELVSVCRRGKAERLPWWQELPALHGLLLCADAAIPSSVLPRAAGPRLVEQFEPLGLQVPCSCGQSNAITCSHQFV